MKRLFPSILVLLLLFTGCKKDKGNPPALPPAESMSIDFSNFDNSKGVTKELSNIKGTENSNWAFAALVATTWKLVITTNLAVPVAAFNLAIDQTPVYVSEKNWKWTYNVSVGSDSYKATLTGQIGTGDVTWKMLISKNSGEFTDFMWFEGTSKLDGTSGQWIIYENPASPSQLVQIDWTKTDVAIGSVKYTWLKSGSFQGSYIEYGKTSNTFNAYYTIHYYNGVKFSDVNVEWSTTSHNGRIKSIDYLGDSVWHCWDTNKINGNCS